MITVLSFGAGQDSTAILYRLALDRKFYARYVKGRLIVIMSDTGDEHQYTYDHVAFVKEFCLLHDIEFHFIQAKDGFHPSKWPGLIEWMKAYSGIMAKAFPKSCTDNLKIKPIYNFLDNLIGKQYYNQNVKPSKSRKKFIKRYAAEHGKIRILLGIAKGEETRVSTNFSEKWMNNSLDRIYPLIMEGMTRQDCQDDINAQDLPLPPPSNCKRCPFISDIELLWLFRFYPDDFWEWVDMEGAKISKWRALGIPDEKNLGVNGTRLLPEVLERALAKYGHLTDEELIAYKMSHGHCVQSKY